MVLPQYYSGVGGGIGGVPHWLMIVLLRGSHVVRGIKIG